MGDLDRVLRWFEAGTLRRPDPLRPSTVSLSQSLAVIGGVEMELDAPARRVCEAIGAPGHVILVLADGLGMTLVESLPETSFLRRHVAFEMQSVFPSSTAPALTSLACGQWPAAHGLLGWFSFLPDLDLHIVSLPFRQRFTGLPLNQIGVSGQDVFGWPSLLRSYTRSARLLMPRSIARSVYTAAIAGGVTVDSYKSLDQAVTRLLTRLDGERQAQTYTYFYYPNIDSAAHKHGVGSAEVKAEVEAFDAALERLRAGLDGRARIVVSSDHGGIDLDSAQKLILDPGEHLASLLRTPPSGEPRAPIFHVKAGMQAEFEAAFRDRFGGAFALLTAAECIELGLLGPDLPAPVARERMGDYVGIAGDRCALVYGTDQAMVQMVGFHGGLDPDEVRIPLVIA